MDCQAKPSRKTHRPQRRVKNPDGSLRSIKDRADLATITEAYLERAKAETARKLAGYRDATPNGRHLLTFSRGTHEATRAMLVDLTAQTMVLRHLIEVQRRDADAVIAALAERIDDLEAR